MKNCGGWKRLNSAPPTTNGLAAFAPTFYNTEVGKKAKRAFSQLETDTITIE